MRRLKFFQTIAVLTLAIALVPRAVPAQEGDTLTISGTFNMDGCYGTLSPDLAQVYANDRAHTWTLTLHGVNYVHDYVFDEWIDGGYYNSYEEWATYVYATSADFHFEGPDADLLNQIVDQQLLHGVVMDGAADTAFLKLWYARAFDASDPFTGGVFPAWNFRPGTWPSSLPRRSRWSATTTAAPDQ
jgi:hypothetical protein